MVKSLTPKQKGQLKKSGPLKRKQAGSLKAKGVSPKAKKMVSPSAMKMGVVMSKKTDSSAVKKLNTPKAKKTKSPAGRKTKSSVVKQKDSQAVKKTKSPAVISLGSPAAKSTDNQVVKRKMAKKGKIKIQTGFPLIKKVGNSVVKKRGISKVKRGSLAAKKKTSTRFLALKKSNDKQFRREALLLRQNSKKVTKKKRGVVVLSNIPHGFFEGEMFRYFRQFGVIEDLKLVRSKRTGQSCGYAYIEFEHYEVAKIVAQHMDGYLTFGKIMKCKVLRPQWVTDTLFEEKDIRPDNCPKLKKRIGAINKLNSERTEEQIQRREDRLTSTYIKKVKKLQELGVDISLETLIGKSLPQEEQQDEGDTTQLTNGHVTPEDQAELSFPEDTSDVEPSEDIDPDLTEGQKMELSVQREELATLIKSHLESAKKKKLKKAKTANKTQDSAEMIMIEVDESEDEVVLKTPPNAIKKYVKMGSKSTPATTPKTKNPTPKGENRTPKVKMMTPKAKKIKMVPQGETQPLKGMKKTPKEENTPKAKKIKMSPKGKISTPRLMQSTPEEISVTEEPSIATPKPKITTPVPQTETPGPETGTLKSGKATPKSGKKAGVLKTKKATPRREELEPVDSLPTPKTKKQKLIAPKGEIPTPSLIQKTPEKLIVTEEPSIATPGPKTETPEPKLTTLISEATPKSGKKTGMLKTKKATPKSEGLPDTPRIIEIDLVDSLPTPKTKKQKLKAKESLEDIQVTPSNKEELLHTDLITPKSGKKTPSNKTKTPKMKHTPAGEPQQIIPSLDMLDSENISLIEILPMSRGKVKTPKAKNQTPVTRNLPGKKKTPKSKKLGTPGENKENTGDSTPKGKSRLTLTPTPSLATKAALENTVTSEATPGGKKKASQTPAQTPTSKRKQNMTPLNEPTSGKKKKMNKVTPVITQETVVTPALKTPVEGKKTPKVKPTKRKSMLVYPHGKSPSKKQKGRLSLG